MNFKINLHLLFFFRFMACTMDIKLEEYMVWEEKEVKAEIWIDL